MTNAISTEQITESACIICGGTYKRPRIAFLRLTRHLVVILQISLSNSNFLLYNYLSEHLKLNLDLKIKILVRRSLVGARPVYTHLDYQY